MPVLLSVEKRGKGTAPPRLRHRPSAVAAATHAGQTSTDTVRCREASGVARGDSSGCMACLRNSRCRTMRLTGRAGRDDFVPRRQKLPAWSTTSWGSLQRDVANVIALPDLEGQAAGVGVGVPLRDGHVPGGVVGGPGL